MEQFLHLFARFFFHHCLGTLLSFKQVPEIKANYNGKEHLNKGQNAPKTIGVFSHLYHLFKKSASLILVLLSFANFNLLCKKKKQALIPLQENIGYFFGEI
jgi:hypothetical protein